MTDGLPKLNGLPSGCPEPNRLSSLDGTGCTADAGTGSGKDGIASTGAEGTAGAGTGAACRYRTCPLQLLHGFLQYRPVTGHFDIL